VESGDSPHLLSQTRSDSASAESLQNYSVNIESHSALTQLMGSRVGKITIKSNADKVVSNGFKKVMLIQLLAMICNDKVTLIKHETLEQIVEMK
jgi:hypothetical protein